uniref:PSI domain-containing protein n=1 Tax=viral metagenome TaxID=1070528 RepID=A0A6C0D7U2_9ZZZZ
MVKNKNMFYIFLFTFSVLTIMILFKYTVKEGFQFNNCSSITNCKTCADTRGCTFCGDKCVNNDVASSQCGTSSKITDSQFCPEVTMKCDEIKDCKTCANRLDCTFCKTSNKCVKASKSEELCPRESTVTTAEACGLTSLVEDSSGNLTTNLYGQCSSATNCNQCMSTPACYWCSNQKKCVSNIQVYEECMDDKIISSLSQCSNKNEPTYSEDISGVIFSNAVLPSQVSEDSVTISSSETIVPSTNNVIGPNNSISFSSMKSNISEYPNDSIIPVLGLSRTSTGLLTDNSIQIIIDALKAKGYTLKDSASKNSVLSLIKKETDYYNNLLKNNVSSYVNNSLDFVSDGTSLNKARNIRQHIEDLNIVSRYVEAINTSTFVEAYIDLDISKTKFEDTVQLAKATNFNIELLWVANLVVLGFIFFV